MLSSRLLGHIDTHLTGYPGFRRHAVISNISVLFHRGAYFIICWNRAGCEERCRR